MKIKPVLILLTTGVVAWALWSGVLGAGFDKLSRSSGQNILNFEKYGRSSKVGQSRFHRRIKTFLKDSNAAFQQTRGAEWVQQCQEQPALFGMLFISVGVSTCGVAFIVHMIRSDARF